MSFISEPSSNSHLFTNDTATSMTPSTSAPLADVVLPADHVFLQPGNRLSKMVYGLQRYPAFMQRWLRSKLFGHAIKLAGTASVQVDSLTLQQSVLSLANHRKVQNHIGGIHAAAMALLGESATGFLVGMHVPDDRLPLLKSMHLDYVKRASGAMKAVAQLTDAQIHAIHSQEKGEISVQVALYDSAGIEPVLAQFVWAWVPKKR